MIIFKCRERSNKLKAAFSDPEGRGSECQDLPGKSQVAIGFLRNTGTDPLKKKLDPLDPTASQGRFVRPSVKYVDD